VTRSRCPGVTVDIMAALYYDGHSYSATFNLTRSRTNLHTPPNSDSESSAQELRNHPGIREAKRDTDQQDRTPSQPSLVHSSLHLAVLKVLLISLLSRLGDHSQMAFRMWKCICMISFVTKKRAVTW
jgi:hypothetical protein